MRSSSGDRLQQKPALLMIGRVLHLDVARSAARCTADKYGRLCSCRMSQIPRKSRPHDVGAVSTVMKRPAAAYDASVLPLAAGDPGGL